MKPNGIRKTGAVLGALALALALTHEAAAAGSGGGLVTTTSGGSASSSTTVSLKIPAIIGIDVESDVLFDLTTGYSPGVSPGQCNGFFPPYSSCASATYVPTITTTAGATPAPEAGAIYVAILDTTSTSTSGKALRHSIAGTWTGSTPGISTQAVQTKRAVTNNPSSIGNASFTLLPTTAAAVSGTIPSTAFNWLRVDQVFQLVIPSSAVVSDTSNATAVVTYSFARS